MNSVPIKPYLMRAIHEWCSDHGHTPYLVAAVKGKMQVPMEFVKNGEIVLNISYNATRNLQLGDDYVRFSARFGGVSRDIIVPIGAVVSLFSRETGEGMAWEPELTEAAEAGEVDRPASSLRPVPQEPVDQTADADEPSINEQKPAAELDDEPTPPPAPGRSHLRIVK